MKLSSLSAHTNGSAVAANAGRAILRVAALSIVLAVGASLIPLNAFAKKTPDGQTPAEESVCDVLTGAAFGICNAYCEATDCGDGVNYAAWQACASLQKNWKKKTGISDMPCDCDAGFVFVPARGCECGVDFTVTILAVRLGECVNDLCEHQVDVEVANQGIENVVGDIEVLIELSNGTMKSVLQPGLDAGTSEQILNIAMPAAASCFTPDCDAKATVDPSNGYEECDELNNVDTYTENG